MRSRGRRRRRPRAATPGGAPGSSSCGGAHPVSDSAHVLDVFRAELLAEVVDVDLDGVALHFLAPAVEALLELRARQHLARSLEQRLEQRELAVREVHRGTVARDLVARGV